MIFEIVEDGKTLKSSSTSEVWQNMKNILIQLAFNQFEFEYPKYPFVYGCPIRH